MKKARFLTNLMSVLLLLMLGCNSGDDSKVSTGSGSEQIETSFSFSMAAIQKQLVADADGKQLSFTTDQVMTGQLQATNTDTSVVQVFDWSIYFDEDTFAAQSNKTIILTPGTYEFALLLVKGDQQYAGSITGQAISDGTFDVPMTIRPIIGNTITDVTLVASLAEFKFQYDPAELAAAGLVNPQMGIIIGSDPEVIYGINPLSGISDTWINLVEGSNSIQLKLYDGSLQVGRSISAQETVIVSAGLNITMDLVALHGETTFALTEAGGDANFTFNIPAEVVDEAGGLANLHVLFSLVGSNNPLDESVLTLASNGTGDYEASVTLSNKQFDDVTLSLTFTDTSVSELLGSCSMAATLDTTARTVNCAVTLRRRSIIGGSLLATLGVNVFNEAGEPVAGATVSENGNILGVTGSGAFGTEGYLKVYLSSGNYQIKAEYDGKYGELQLTAGALGISNIDIVTSILAGLGSSCIQLDAWGAPYRYVKMTLTFSNSSQNASYRPVFFSDRSCSIPQWNERRERTRVATGTVTAGNGELFSKVESTVMSRPYFTPLADEVTTFWNFNGMEDRNDWITGVERISLNTGQGCDGSEMSNCPGAVFFQEYFIDTSVTPARLFISESTDGYVDLSSRTDPSSLTETLYFQWLGGATPTGLDGDWSFYSKSGTISGSPPSDDPIPSGTWENMGTVDQLITFGTNCQIDEHPEPIACDQSTAGREVYIADQAVYIDIDGNYPGGMGVPQGHTISLSGRNMIFVGYSNCDSFNSTIVTAERYVCNAAP